MTKINSFFYVIKQGFVSLFRNKLFTLASVATITACLFLFSLFYSLFMNFQKSLNNAEQAVSVTVFFQADTEEETIKQIGKKIEARVEVAKVVYVSDDEAWATFGPDYFGEDYAVGFPENPLKGWNNYEVYLSDVAMQDTLITWLYSFPEVRKVNYSEVTANTLSDFNKLLVYVSIAIFAVLLAVSIFLISNTVSVGITVRSEEIMIMKYVGATDFLVRGPFVIEGMLIGLIGSLIPIYLIYLLYNYALSYIVNRFPILSGMFSFLTTGEVIHGVAPFLLILGVGIGLIGSFVSVRKRLHV